MNRKQGNNDMRNNDSIIRYTAFYISLALYFVLLPIILSYSLGYHIDFRNFKIYKMGILSLKSAPSGASIYINGKLRKELTPARIEELKPGTYSVEIRMKGLYPWQKDLAVMPNMVTKAENILLFPISQDMQQIGDLQVKNFIVPDNKSYIYQMTDSGLYRSNIDGTNPKKLSLYSDWPEKIIDKKFSPDGKKFLYFNENNIWVVYLFDRELQKNSVLAYVEEVFKTPAVIRNVFWHSGSHHIVFVVNRDIDVIEFGSGAQNNIVNLHKCNRVPRGLFYDDNNDSLYFNDNYDGKDHIYRLDLRENFYGKVLERVKKEFDIIYEQEKR